MVFAATDEQEQQIKELLFHLRTNILPDYVSSQELNQYDDMGLLEFSSHDCKYHGTLKEAYQVMTALKMLISIIEYVNKSKDVSQYEELFIRNVTILNDYSLFFPFTIQCFKEKQKTSSKRQTYMVITDQKIC